MLFYHLLRRDKNICQRNCKKAARKILRAAFVFKLEASDFPATHAEIAAVALFPA
jgi:hypothetical protein